MIRWACGLNAPPSYSARSVWLGRSPQPRLLPQTKIQNPSRATHQPLARCLPSDVKAAKSRSANVYNEEIKTSPLHRPSLARGVRLIAARFELLPVTLTDPDRIAGADAHVGGERRFLFGIFASMADADLLLFRPIGVALRHGHRGIDR